MKIINFQYFGRKQFFIFKTSLLLLNFCLYVYILVTTNALVPKSTHTFIRQYNYSLRGSSIVPLLYIH